MSNENINIKDKKAGLISEEDIIENKDDFSDEISKNLEQTEIAVKESLKELISTDDAKSWASAREVVASFKPVPWFIWRISNFVMGTTGQINTLNEGFVIGLRRLLFAVASDATIGTGEKVNNVKKALNSVSHDVIAASAVIHAICRKLCSKEFERIWRPILDDAILRSQIGSLVGMNDETFGSGRGMLAGFASRAGLAVLLASGDLDSARKALELLAGGSELPDVGMKIYNCNPLQVTAMLLSASGCGRDAAFGTVSYAYKDSSKKTENIEQLKWLAAFSITENIRAGKVENILPEYWEVLNIKIATDQEHLLTHSKRLIRRGHDWSWII